MNEALIKVPKITVKISDGCITACSSCEEGNKKLVTFNEFQVQTMKDKFLSLVKLIDLDMLESVALYGPDVFQGAYMMDFIVFFRSIKPDLLIIINVPNLLPYDKDFFKKVIVLRKEYNLSYVCVRNVKDLDVFNNKEDWLKICKVLNQYPDLFSPLSIRYDDTYIKDIRWFQNIERIFPHVDFSFAKYPYTDHGKKQFISEKLGTDKCKYYYFLDSSDTGLYFQHPENEINLMLNGDITMHTNICYLSKYRYITNVSRTQDEVQKDIIIFYKNLKKVNEGSRNLFESCYKCIYGY